MNKGSIYLCIEKPFSNKVKIGRTSEDDGYKRLAGIQNGNPNKVEFYYFTEPIPYYKVYEGNLHLAFKHKKIRGEWFEMDELELECLVEEIMEDEEMFYDEEYHGAEIIKKVLEGVKKYDRLFDNLAREGEMCWR